MKKLVLICLAYSGIILQLGYSENIRFDIRREYCIGNCDQQYFRAASVSSNLLYVLWDYHTSQFISTGVRLSIINSGYAPPTYEDYYNIPMYNYAMNSWWDILYTFEKYQIPDDQYLLNLIIRSGDYLCLPVKNQTYHKLTLDGRLIGTYPNTPEIDDIVNPKINCKGNLLTVPFHIADTTVENVVFLDSALILFSSEKFMVVNKKDFSANGEAAVKKIFNRSDNIFDSADLKLHPLNNDYFLCLDQFGKTINLLYASPVDGISVIPCLSLPAPSSNPDWYCCEGGKYYQIEPAGYMVLKLVEYDIKGLPGVSFAENFEYK